MCFIIQLNLNFAKVYKKVYLWHSLGHLPANRESLDKCACSDECPGNLSLELPGHVSKGLQLVGVLTDTLQIVLSDDILGVEQCEHTLQQPWPKVIKHFLQVNIPSSVIALELGEQVLKNLRVLHVRLAVSPHKHLIQGPLCVLQQLQEEFWFMKRRKSVTYCVIFFCVMIFVQHMACIDVRW